MSPWIKEPKPTPGGPAESPDKVLFPTADSAGTQSQSPYGSSGKAVPLGIRTDAAWKGQSEDARVPRTAPAGRRRGTRSPAGADAQVPAPAVPEQPRLPGPAA